MYSTGNYIEYPVINHNGKEYKKRKKYGDTGRKCIKMLMGYLDGGDYG